MSIKFLYKTLAIWSPVINQISIDRDEATWNFEWQFIIVIIVLLSIYPYKQVLANSIKFTNPHLTIQRIFPS